MGHRASLRLRVRNQVHIYTFLKAELENSLFLWVPHQHQRYPQDPIMNRHPALYRTSCCSHAFVIGRWREKVKQSPQSLSSWTARTFLRPASLLRRCPLFLCPAGPSGWLLLERFLFQPLTLGLAVLETQFCLRDPCQLRKCALSLKKGLSLESPASFPSLGRLNTDQIASSWAKKYLKNENKGKWVFSKGIYIKLREVCLSVG